MYLLFLGWRVRALTSGVSLLWQSRSRSGSPARVRRPVRVPRRDDGRRHRRRRGSLRPAAAAIYYGMSRRLRRSRRVEPRYWWAADPGLRRHRGSLPGPAACAACGRPVRDRGVRPPCLSAITYERGPFRRPRSQRRIHAVLVQRRPFSPQRAARWPYSQRPSRDPTPLRARGAPVAGPGPRVRNGCTRPLARATPSLGCRAARPHGFCAAGSSRLITRWLD